MKNTNVSMTSGDPSPMLDHMRKLFPDTNDRAQLLAYMAACVQYKGHKFKWCPVIQGVPGNGKTTITNALAYAVGERHVSRPSADQMVKPFSHGWLKDKSLSIVEDIGEGDQQSVIAVKLKEMIAGRVHLIEVAGTKPYYTEINTNFIINTNSLPNGGALSNDRRFPVYKSQQPCNLSGHFSRLYDWLHYQYGYAIFAKYLHDYDIPRDMNPVVMG